MTAPRNTTDHPGEPASEHGRIEAVFTAFREAWQSRDQAALTGCFTSDTQAHLNHLGHFAGGAPIAAGLIGRAPQTGLMRYRTTNSYIAVSGHRAAERLPHGHTRRRT
ncbi:hypothetical protein ACFU93_44480 [Streptomyces sp. NPDC057611]|uniref:hypothetical protein n=1 Tax=Streptomyces sp. NPDC057611 TaxID=3346182 RepID=UPI0036A3811A